MLSANVTRPEKENNFFTQERWRLQEDQQSFTYQSEYCSKSGTNIYKRWNCNHLTETSRSSTEVNTSSGAVFWWEGLKKIDIASSLQLSKEVESQTGVTISRDTIWRTLQRKGMHGCRPRKKPLLKPRHKKARLRVCQGPCWQRWILLGLYTLEWWDQDKCFWNWWLQNSMAVAKVRNAKKNAWCLQWNIGGGSVLMWGCMSAAGVGELHFINGIMNSQMYCSILKEKMLPSLHVPLVVVHFSNMTMILNTHLRPLLDFWRRTGWKWFSGQVCLLIWTQSNTYGEFWRDKLSITLHPASNL